jgi:hypothetical protein
MAGLLSRCAIGASSANRGPRVPLGSGARHLHQGNRPCLGRCQPGRGQHTAQAPVKSRRPALSSSAAVHFTAAWGGQRAVGRNVATMVMTWPHLGRRKMAGGGAAVMGCAAAEPGAEVTRLDHQVRPDALTAVREPVSNRLRVPAGEFQLSAPVRRTYRMKHYMSPYDDGGNAPSPAEFAKWRSGWLDQARCQAAHD